MTVFTRRSWRAARRIPGRLLVAAGALLVLAPLYFLAVFATRTMSEIFTMPPPTTFGDALSLNWQLLQRRLPFLASAGTSAYVGLLQAALAVFLCSLAGFAFAMYEFRLKRALFAMVLAMMFVQPLLLALPRFMILHALGFLDRPIGLWLPGAASALRVFFMRRYVAFVVPKQLVEAARCDGCSEWRVYRSVVLPLLRPGLVTLGLFTFVASWADFAGPLMVLSSPRRFTVPLATLSMLSHGSTPWGAMMLAAALSLVPPLLLVVFSFRKVMVALTAAAFRR